MRSKQRLCGVKERVVVKNATESPHFHREDKSKDKRVQEVRVTTKNEQNQILLQNPPRKYPPTKSHDPERNHVTVFRQSSPRPNTETESRSPQMANKVNV